MRHHNILGKTPTVPCPETILSTLQEAGHPATLIQVRYWQLSAYTMELAVAPNGTRVIIDASEDLHTDRDIDTSAHDSVEAWVDECEITSIRRLINVRHWEHTDSRVIASLLDYLLRVTRGKLVQESLECKSDDA